MVKIFDVRLAKNAFGRFQVKGPLLQSSKDTVKMAEVRLEIATVDQDIIEENQYKFTYVWSKQGVHGSMKCGGCIA